MVLQEKIKNKSEGFGKLASVFLEGDEFALENQWISVEEKLPKQDEEVIVLCDDLNVAPNYKIAFGHIVDKNICQDYNGWNIPNVVYWFPMPNIPTDYNK